MASSRRHLAAQAAAQVRNLGPHPGNVVVKLRPKIGHPGAQACDLRIDSRAERVQVLSGGHDGASMVRRMLSTDPGRLRGHRARVQGEPGT